MKYQSKWTENFKVGNVWGEICQLKNRGPNDMLRGIRINSSSHVNKTRKFHPLHDEINFESGISSF